MAQLSINLLGPFQIFLDHQGVRGLESAKVRALLAYLAAESGRPHSRDALVGLLWPDFTEESARHNLRQALFNLRSSLGDQAATSPYLIISRESVQFNQQSDFSLDLDQFNQYYSAHEAELSQAEQYSPSLIKDLEEMDRLYHGEFLEHFFIEDSTEFEEWALVQRENLHQKALEVLKVLANFYEQKGDFQAARRFTSRQLELDPWREEAHRQMMRVLALDGERSAALAQYESCKQILAKELDIEPSAETQELYEQIRLGKLVQPAEKHSDTSSTVMSNLQIQLTPFVGREVELAQLKQLLAEPECRCITLVGPGGIGKTRLAIQTAANLLDQYTHGVVFVPLASVMSMIGVIPAILNAMNSSLYAPGDLKTYLLNTLQNKQLLIVLDNVEHLLSDNGSQENITQLIVEILQNAPGVKILLTSREALNLQGEWLLEVPGLAFPADAQTESAVEYDAITLFNQRAQRANPKFALTKDTLLPVARICRLVDGMPLAIELAATWMRVLSPAEIADEIDHSLDFLTSNMRDIPERHRSMRVVFDYSWQMLTAEEQEVLSKLSVFRGGFQRQAAEQVAGATLMTLSTLVNRTLLRRTSSGRYDLHELVRQYCATRLAVNPQKKQATQEKHYAYYFQLADEAEGQLKGPSQLEWLSRLEQEHDNLRAALEWALENAGQTGNKDDRALRLSSALRWFWRMRGHFHEGYSWLDEALKKSTEAPIKARGSALLGKSLLANGLGDLGAAIDPAEKSVALFRKIGCDDCLAEALLISGLTLLWQGVPDLGSEQTKEALEIYRKIGDQWGEAQALYRLGHELADYKGNQAGRAILEESAAILERMGEKYLLTSVLIALGIVDMSLGNYAVAQKSFERGLATTREIKHPWGIADALTNLGCLHSLRGDYAAAQAYFEEALQVYHEHGRNLWEIDVLCAMAENAISQGKLSVAQSHLSAAESLLMTSENKWLQVLVNFFNGLLAYHEGKLEQASMHLERAIDLARAGQFLADLTRSLITLGRVRIQQADTDQAIALIHEGFKIFKKDGNKLGIIHAIEALASLYATGGEAVQAVKLYALVSRMREELGAPLPEIERKPQEAALKSCRKQLSDEQFTRAWDEAEKQTTEQVVDKILSGTM